MMRDIVAKEYRWMFIPKPMNDPNYVSSDPKIRSLLLIKSRMRYMLDQVSLVFLNFKVIKELSKLGFLASFTDPVNRLKRSEKRPVDSFGLVSEVFSDSPLSEVEQ